MTTLTAGQANDISESLADVLDQLDHERVWRLRDSHEEWRRRAEEAERKAHDEHCKYKVADADAVAHRQRIAELELDAERLDFLQSYLAGDRPDLPVSFRLFDMRAESQCVPADGVRLFSDLRTAIDAYRRRNLWA